MTDRQLDLQWVPFDNSQFITWGSELRHYTVVQSSSHPHEGDELDGWVAGAAREPLNDHRSAVLLATLSEPHYIKCVDLWPGPAVIVAAGQAIGRISFVGFSMEEDSPTGRFLLGKELTPRTARHCTAVAWHPASDGHGQLASGYEKHRSDFGLLVWDLLGGSRSGGIDKPVTEIGMTDSVASLAWFQPVHSLAAGINNKMVRLFDTRTPSKLAGTTMTRATSGLCVDPASDYRLAGHTENTVVIWDTRNFEKPIVSLESQGRQVNKLAWCPTRPGLLGSSSRDSSSIVLYDIMSWAVGQEDGEPSVTERSVSSPHDQELGSLGSFAWHPSLENTLLAVGAWGRFAEWRVSDRLTVNWSACHSLVWSSGQGRLETLDIKQIEDVTDIAVTIEARCRDGYAGDSNMEEVGKKCGDPDLGLTWAWAHHVSQLVAEGRMKIGTQGMKFPGVKPILKSVLAKSNPHSEPRPAVWVGLDNRKTMKVFKSEERESVLKLCGWVGDRQMSLSSLGPVALACHRAAVAVFNLDLRTALEELKQSSIFVKNEGNNDLANILNMVCVAVSGYSSDSSTNSLWREMVTGALDSLPDPSLRAMFDFLTCEDEDYSSVLEQDGLLLIDKVGFAVTFLSDEKLSLYLDHEWERLVNCGQLSGLLLSGGNSDGVQLVQSFVDRTGDVQTASWLAVRILPPDLAHSDQVTSWLDSYRTMLDQWYLFTARAELDIALTSACSSGGYTQPYHQVYVSCHFCGKSVSPWYKGLPKGGKTGSLSRQGGSGGNKVKLQSCPNCKKPLPRCAVCLVNMGTASGTTLLSPDILRPQPDSKDNPVSEFGSWFTWCQTCRHGGHANHLLDWFMKHSDCPVTGCSCKCGQLDSLNSDIPG